MHPVRRGLMLVPPPQLDLSQTYTKPVDKVAYLYLTPLWKSWWLDSFLFVVLLFIRLIRSLYRVCWQNKLSVSLQYMSIVMDNCTIGLIIGSGGDFENFIWHLVNGWNSALFPSVFSDIAIPPLLNIKPNDNAWIERAAFSLSILNVWSEPAINEIGERGQQRSFLSQSVSRSMHNYSLFSFSLCSGIQSNLRGKPYSKG